MRIAYVGNIKAVASDGEPFNTEWHISETLRDMGHTVTFIQEDEIQFGTLPNRVARHDLFMWTRTWKGHVLQIDLNAIHAMGIPTVSYHLDKYTGLQRDGGLADDPFWRTQYVFSPEGSVQAKQIFKQHGINQYYLPAGVYAKECYIDSSGHYPYDIVFVGGGKEYAHPEWHYRKKLITFLEDFYGPRFHKFGHPQPLKRGKELNELYARTKIVIGDSLCKDFTDSYYFSDRVFETTGRGGFMIHPYIPGITDHFEDREHIVLYAYDNFVQLKNLIDYYLEHDEEREAIRLKGHGQTIINNTYHNRLTDMFNILDLKGAIIYE